MSHFDPQETKESTRIHSQTANRAVGTGFQDMTVSNFRHTIDLIELIARNQARELDHWIADSNRVIGVHWINHNPKGQRNWTVCVSRNVQ